MKRTGNSGKRGKTVLALFLCLIFFAGGAGALEIQPGELSLSAAESGQSSGRLFEMRLRFAPDGTQILDSYRIEISYDPKALEFSSGKILSDRFNGSFEMIEDDGLLSVIYLAASAVIALGYSVFYVEVLLPNGSVGQLLDIMDYVSNSVMMPFIALLSTVLIGWVMTPDYVIDEMERNGETFRRKKLYRVMIRYVAPVMMLVLFLQSTGILAKIG